MLVRNGVYGLWGDFTSLSFGTELNKPAAKILSKSYFLSATLVGVFLYERLFLLGLSVDTHTGLTDGRWGGAGKLNTFWDA